MLDYRSVPGMSFVMQTTIHTEVVASIAKPEQVVSNVSNMFTFIFEVDRPHVTSKLSDETSSPGVKRVLPATEEEVQKVAQYL